MKMVDESIQLACSTCISVRASLGQDASYWLTIPGCRARQRMRCLLDCFVAIRQSS